MAETAQTPPARIAILEDDPMVRRYFTAILARDPAYEVIGVADSLAAARPLAAQVPDLFLIDVMLPDGRGYDLLPEIRAAGDVKVLVISTLGDRDTVVAALSAGADGYLLKDSTPEQVLDGIAMTLAGGAPVSPAAAVYLLELLRGQAGPTPAAEPLGDHGLTPRETDLLHQFAAGHSYKEAARNLGISPHTVGNHVKAIYRKLEVNSRSEAVRAVGLWSR